MRMLTETATYTTTLNPADELMATFDLMKGESGVVWGPGVSKHNFYPHVLLSVDNVDVGANITIEVSGDTIAGDHAAHDDFALYQIGTLATTAPAATYVIPTATARWILIEADTADTREDHVFETAPRIHLWVSATCAAAKTVNITCHMSG